MSTTILDLQWYQHLHDGRYHRDIAVMPTMRRLNHLTHHLVKYSDNPHKGADYYTDSIACILSMAGGFNMSLAKAMNLYVITPVEGIESIGYLWNDEILAQLFKKHIQTLSKAIEAFDHIEKYEYRTKIEEAIAHLFIIVFQQFGITISEGTRQDKNLLLIKRYMERLEEIKKRHVFHSYFHEELSRNKTYCEVREEFLP